MANQTAHGSINVPANSKFLSTEVNRTLSMAREDLSDFRKTLFFAQPLVYSGLAVSATGAGLQVTVATGEGIDGAGYPIYIPPTVPSTAVAFSLPAEGTAPNVTLAAADPTNPRIDLVCLRAATLLTDFTNVAINSGGTITNQVEAQTELAYFSIVTVTGTPAGSPVAPSPLLATDLVLAKVTVPAAATMLVSGNIADARTMMGGIPRINAANSFSALQTFQAGVDVSGGDLTISTGKATISGLLIAGNTYPSGASGGPQLGGNWVTAGVLWALGTDSNTDDKTVKLGTQADGAWAATALNFLVDGSIETIGAGTIGGDLTLTTGRFHSPVGFSLFDAGNGAQTLAAGGVLASSTYTDINKVPTDGIYSAGAIVTASSFTAGGVGTFNLADNEYVSLNRDANTSSVLLEFTTAGAATGSVGISRHDGSDIVAGGTPDSIVVRAENHDILFSADAGASILLALNANSTASFGAHSVSMGNLIAIGGVFGSVPDSGATIQAGSVVAGEYEALNLNNSTVASAGVVSTATSIRLGWTDAGSGVATVPKIVAMKDGDYTIAANANAHLSLYTVSGNALVEAAHFSPGGYLGLGTTPVVNLHLLSPGSRASTGGADGDFLISDNSLGTGNIDFHIGVNSGGGTPANAYAFLGAAGGGATKPIYINKSGGPVFITESLTVGTALIRTWPQNSAFSAFMNSALSANQATDYALLQEDDGTTFLNAAAGKAINLNLGGANIAQWSGGGSASTPGYLVVQSHATAGSACAQYLGNWPETGSLVWGIGAASVGTSSFTVALGLADVTTGIFSANRTFYLDVLGSIRENDTLLSDKYAPKTMNSFSNGWFSSSGVSTATSQYLDLGSDTSAVYAITISCWIGMGLTSDTVRISLESASDSAFTVNDSFQPLGSQYVGNSETTILVGMADTTATSNSRYVRAQVTTTWNGSQPFSVFTGYTGIRAVRIL